MREIKFKYGFSNGTDCFYKDFTLDEIEEGRQFDEISDSPLLNDYKIVGIAYQLGFRLPRERE